MKTDFVIDETGRGARSRAFTGPDVHLGALPEGVTGRIVSVDTADADVERLEVMGLCAGRTVEVVQAGDPMIVRVLGTRIGLAALLARSVRVHLDRID
jgi:Fe2+ transport system protein FeoA